MHIFVENAHNTFAIWNCISTAAVIYKINYYIDLISVWAILEYGFPRSIKYVKLGSLLGVNGES